jgi:hypothetical protein
VCGRGYEDAELARLLDELVASTGARLLRTWAFARFTDGGRDFSTLDRLIAAARARGLRLVLTLENEWRDCTDADATTSDGRKGAAWIAAHWAAGTDGFLVWSFYDLVPGDPQGWDFDGADPLAAVLRRHAAE